MRLPRLLFFVEPVVFRDSPPLLTPWIDAIGAMVRASAGRFEAHIATSRLLCDVAGTGYASRSALSGAALLEPFGFDRIAYMRDLCLGDGLGNQPLAQALASVRARVEPDIIVTWTGNATLRRAFAGIPVLHLELGPMPRDAFALAGHLDPFGHQRGSAFDRLAEPCWDNGPFEALIAQWLARFHGRAADLSRDSGLDGWLATLPPGRRRAVFALQPPDWPTYEGIGPALDPVSLLRRAAAAADPDELVIPQWHPAQRPPDEALLAALATDHPNLAIPPERLRIARTEALLPHVGRLITISSNAALAAAILGKELTLLGSCKFSVLATRPGARPAARTDLIPFVVGAYCRPFAEWTDRDGGFFDRVRTLAEDPESLLRPSAFASALAPFL